MAIFAAGAGYVQPVVHEGIMFSVGAQGQLVAGPSTTNRLDTTQRTVPAASAPNPSFSQLDNEITSLDASYDLLTDKSPWVAYAAAIAGLWRLCANCQPDAAGKKLYRQYNWNRSLIGLPRVTAPVDGTAYGPAVPAIAEYNPLGLPIGTLGFTQCSSPHAYYLVVQNGLGLLNPIVHLAASLDPQLFTLGSTNWNALLGLQPATLYLACGFDDNGAPGLGEQLFMTNQP